MATQEAPISFDDVARYFRAGGKELRAKYPKIYGALGGFAGVAPDEFDGSVLDPLTAAVRQGAEYGFPLGTAMGVAPMLGGIAAAKGAITGGKTAQKGMLRLGGREDLIASHGTSAASLVDESGRLIPEFTNLSLAIEKNRLANPWGDTKLILRPNRLDPATSPSIIHTNDAFTPPSWMSELSMLGETNAKPTLNALVKARMQDRFLRQYPRGGAGAESEGAGALGSRMFNSFKGFEKSPQGADAVLGVTAPAQGELKLFKDMLERITDEQGGNTAHALRKIMELPGQYYKGFDKYKLYKQIMAEPRAYAELKSFGQTPINADTFSGAIIKKPTSSTSLAQRQAVEALRDALADQRMPSVYSSNAPSVDFGVAAAMQKDPRKFR